MKILFSTLMILCAMYAAAQTGTWVTTPNVGLYPYANPQGHRYDDIYFLDKDTGVLVSSYGILFKTYDGGGHWAIRLRAPLDYFRSVEFSDDGNTGFTGTLSGTFYRSSDRGESWHDITEGIGSIGRFPRRVCGMGHWGNNIFIGVGWWGGDTACVYVTEDGGTTWETRYIDAALATGLVDAVFLNDHKVLVSGTRITRLQRESVVLLSNDRGVTWTRVFHDTAVGGRIWKLQAIDNDYIVGSIEPVAKDTVAMIKSTDGGLTWSMYGVGHKRVWASGWGTQGIGFQNRLHGWLGGYYDGMYETTDGGVTWDTIPAGQSCNRYFRVGNEMYLSGSAVYKYTDTGTASVMTTQPLFAHKLYEVAPNPARGRVPIEFDINYHSTNTVVEVYNVDNGRVYPVRSGYLLPGHYAWEWDATGAAPGNYIVWLGTDEVPMVTRFTVVR